MYRGGDWSLGRVFTSAIARKFGYMVAAGAVALLLAFFK